MFLLFSSVWLTVALGEEGHLPHLFVCVHVWCKLGHLSFIYLGIFTCLLKLKGKRGREKKKKVVFNRQYVIAVAVVAVVFTPSCAVPCVHKFIQRGSQF